MRPHRALALLAFTLAAVAGPGLAHAAFTECWNDLGWCEIGNFGVDYVECNCAGPVSGSNIGGNVWAGLTEMELEPICEQELQDFCSPVPFVDCSNAFGYCAVQNEPEDLVECFCSDFSAPVIMGGTMWAGYSEAQLLVECEAQLDALCLAPPTSLVCDTAYGQCTVANVPSDFLACECTNGAYQSGDGGHAWAGYSELELYEACGVELQTWCGGPLPWSECSSSLGSCVIDNAPHDRLECSCTDGTEFSDGGGSDWAALSDEELFTMCEERLFEGCSASSAESSGGTDAGDEPGTSGASSTGDFGSSGGASSTGEPGDDGGLDGTTEASTAHPPSTPGDGTTGDASEGSDGVAPAAGDGGGCSCSTDGRSRAQGWALLLLGLGGVVARRRRATGLGSPRTKRAAGSSTDGASAHERPPT